MIQLRVLEEMFEGVVNVPGWLWLKVQMGA